MSLYQLQKFLYQINRDPAAQQRFRADRRALLDAYELTAEERGALEAGEFGFIYVLGANGQLLMHFAAFLGLTWPDYSQAMRDGVAKHGPVRAGVYNMTTGMDEKVAGVRATYLPESAATHRASPGGPAWPTRRCANPSMPPFGACATNCSRRARRRWW
jgi:hypothetical protein